MTEEITVSSAIGILFPLPDFIDQEETLLDLPNFFVKFDQDIMTNVPRLKILILMENLTIWSLTQLLFHARQIKTSSSDVFGTKTEHFGFPGKFSQAKASFFQFYIPIFKIFLLHLRNEIFFFMEKFQSNFSKINLLDSKSS